MLTLPLGMSEPASPTYRRLNRPRANPTQIRGRFVLGADLILSLSERLALRLVRGCPVVVRERGFRPAAATLFGILTVSF